MAPPVTEIEAARIARELYGIDSIARALPGEYDDNFHLKTPDGRAFVFKVMHAARERSFIDMQCRALQHLAERTPHLALPRVFPARSGAAFTPAILADGSERIVWMLSFLPGIVLADARPHTQELLQSLGRLLGEMDQALVEFSHPAAQRGLKWDLARPGWIRDYLHCIADSTRRRIVEKFLDLYESAVVPVLPQLRRSAGRDHPQSVRALDG